MTQALKGRGGICARVIETGTVRVADEIEIRQPAEERPQGNEMNDERHKSIR
jgi:MOSC domain-containing protein YiiM